MSTATRFRATAAAAFALAPLFTIAALVAPTGDARAAAVRVSPATTAAAQTLEKYRVFCVNGKVDFGSRTLQEMQWDFGKNVCQLAEFDSYREAKDDVRRRGGVGADCKCG
ncbi:MAG: hypothetical protein ABR563_04455 [Pyrinomonadaceae bacterium]